MPSQKPTQPPAFDATTFVKTLYDRVRKPDGSAYQVFEDKALARWKRWLDGTVEYDGTGLRDTVNANALYLDQVKNDLDNHKDADNTRHAALAQRVTALEGQAPATPFPLVSG